MSPEAGARLLTLVATLPNAQARDLLTLINQVEEDTRADTCDDYRLMLERMGAHLPGLAPILTRVWQHVFMGTFPAPCCPRVGPAR
jgi:hypothetical protein